MLIMTAFQERICNSLIQTINLYRLSTFISTLYASASYFSLWFRGHDQPFGISLSCFYDQSCP